MSVLNVWYADLSLGIDGRIVDLRPSRTEQNELDASELAPGATSLIIAV